MTPLRRTTCFATALLVLTLIGCDASETTEATGQATATEDAAVSIANALGIASGGAFEDVAGAVEAADGAARGASDTGCERARDYDDETQTWMQTLACERGDPEGTFYAAFSRTHQLQLFGEDGAPQQYPDGATTLRLDIVDGTGVRRTPVFEHVLNDLEGSFDVDDLDQDLVTVNGTYARAATDTLRTRRAVRTLDYTLDLTFTDVVGPRHRDAGTHRWGHPVSGTVEGRYQALVTFETEDGYREREIDRTFILTFGDEDPVLSIDGEDFELDLEDGLLGDEEEDGEED